MSNNKRIRKRFHKEISVLTFNMLADSLSNSFPNTDPKYLNWVYRKPLILNILLSSSSDIIILQECDRFEEILEVLSVGGYEGVFYKVNNAKYHGTAIFVTKEYPIMERQKLSYNEGSQIANIVVIDVYGYQVAVAGTHLKAGEFEAGKLLEGAELVEHENKFKSVRLRQITKLYANLTERKLPTIIAGDLNEEPHNPAIKFLKERMIDAYADEDEHYTTYKMRTTHVKKQVIDYIFVTPDLQIMSRLTVPRPVDFLPNETYPSDHIYLRASFLLKL